MPPKKRGKHSYKVSEVTQQSKRSTQGQGGHADQLKKAGETLVAPARKCQKETTLDISDAEENPMVPSQLQKPKKKSNECTHEEETESQAPEYGISDNNQDQYQTDGENEERDRVQDQEQMLKTGDTMDFRQCTDNLDSEYNGGAQDDFNNQDFDYELNAVGDFLNQGIDGDFDDEPDAQDNGIDDDFDNELNDTARDKTEESVLIFVLRKFLMFSSVIK
ncbi:uncharacterized protein BJ212DRAFT_1302438 [Suillus subaureus]|uniref:Uncharacterized protein n=1 Tax=Suillus subaureus TaxID=48587 RepID=A0A9P7E274_9AGAM|nr:uncharacterized protein BJ212DRAFT_1302438 [Suillus subaureus]KAG1809586.1 hypothetical protein BJ212DRAFT_1302438 [Suillus subaureus]